MQSSCRKSEIIIRLLSMSKIDLASEQKERISAEFLTEYRLRDKEIGLEGQSHIH
jgi:hypothetical protein